MVTSPASRSTSVSLSFPLSPVGLGLSAWQVLQDSGEERGRDSPPLTLKRNEELHLQADPLGPRGLFLEQFGGVSLFLGKGFGRRGEMQSHKAQDACAPSLDPKIQGFNFVDAMEFFKG